MKLSSENKLTAFSVTVSGPLSLFRTPAQEFMASFSFLNFHVPVHKTDKSKTDWGTDYDRGKKKQKTKNTHLNESYSKNAQSAKQKRNVSSIANTNRRKL